jgi:hypothetical protein
VNDDFWDDQWARRFDEHVAPLNTFVDTIRAEHGLDAPYVAPYYGGTSARLLSVLRDPGHGADKAHRGSGLLCIENADQTSTRQRSLFGEVGIDKADMIPWNAYPFFIHRKPLAAELTLGARLLLQLLELPEVHITVVLLQGNEAKDAWKRLLRAEPGMEKRLGLQVVETIHPSISALQTDVPGERARREVDRRAKYAEAAHLLGDSNSDVPARVADAPIVSADPARPEEPHR